MKLNIKLPNLNPLTYPYLILREKLLVDELKAKGGSHEAIQKAEEIKIYEENLTPEIVKSNLKSMGEKLQRLEVKDQLKVITGLRKSNLITPLRLKG